MQPPLDPDLPPFGSDSLRQALLEHELLDLADGRELARFGPRVIDRPCGAAVGWSPARPRAWGHADARFERGPDGDGRWSVCAGLADSWQVEIDGVVLELRHAPSGQVGVFPEQVATWHWLRERLVDMARRGAAGGVTDTVVSGPLPRVLNLFAYTGASTVAMAGLAEVTHLDAARPTVAWAKKNAGLNEPAAGARIRWIVDDAAAFVARELRRGRRYDGIVLDPPTYGHGTAGRAWRLERDLPALLDGCAGLLAAGSAFIALSAHTIGHDPDRLAAALREAVGADAGGDCQVTELGLTTVDGLDVALGSAAWWHR